MATQRGLPATNDLCDTYLYPLALGSGSAATRISQRFRQCNHRGDTSDCVVNGGGEGDTVRLTVSQWISVKCRTVSSRSVASRANLSYSVFSILFPPGLTPNYRRNRKMNHPSRIRNRHLRPDQIPDLASRYQLNRFDHRKR